MSPVTKSWHHVDGFQLCTFLFWMVLCVIWERCIVVFVNLVYSIVSKQPWGEYTHMDSWGTSNWLLSPGQHGPDFAYNIFKYVFMNEKLCILIWISLKFVPKGPIDHNQHRYREWLGAKQATSHYLNQCWPSSLMLIWALGAAHQTPLYFEWLYPWNKSITQLFS